MANCSKCERPLCDGEEGFCPACKSSNDREKKLWVELGVGVLTTVGAVLFAVLRGKDGDGDSA